MAKVKLHKVDYYESRQDGFVKCSGYQFSFDGYDYVVASQKGTNGKTLFWYVTDKGSGFAVGWSSKTRDYTVNSLIESAYMRDALRRFHDEKADEYAEMCKKLDDYVKKQGKKSTDEGNKQGKKSSDKGAKMGKKRNGFAYFKVDHTTPIENIKRQYRQLAMENHPDMGGDTKTMQAINAEYDKLVKSHYNIHENRKGEVYTDERQTAPDDVTAMFADILDGLIRVLKIDANDIEVCGKFLWLHNTTKYNKHHYKALGFKWSVNKKLWYRAPVGYRGFKHRAWSMDEIRGAYGSYKVNRDEDKAQLPAA